MVQAAPARGRAAAAAAGGRRHAARAAHAQADPHDPQDDRRADRRARDDDAAPVPLVPRPARRGQRLPVGPVPRARGAARAARRARARALPAGLRRPRADRSRDGAAVAVRLVRALPRRRGATSCRRTSLERDVTQPLEPSRGVQERAARGLPRRRRAFAGVRADGRPRRGRDGVALPPRPDGAPDDRRPPRDRRLAGREVPRLDAAGSRRSRISGPSARSCEPDPTSSASTAATRSPRTTRASASPSGCCSPATRTRRGRTSRSRARSTAFDDAALHVDEKWERAFEQAERVRDGFRALLGEPGGELALAASTHDLVLRFLSALDLRARPRLVTTDGEFHTLRRQLARLAEAGLDVVRVPARPVETLAERLAAAADDRDGRGARLGGAVRGRAHRAGPRRALPTPARRAAPSCSSTPTTRSARCRSRRRASAWVVGGGYKYLQLGEGNCFLRLPEHAYGLRPAITGWYAEFGELAAAPRPGQVAYPRGAAAFAGSTYDPTSHYRAARVFRVLRRAGPHAAAAARLLPPPGRAARGGASTRSACPTASSRATARRRSSASAASSRCARRMPPRCSERSRERGVADRHARRTGCGSARRRTCRTRSSTRRSARSAPSPLSGRSGPWRARAARAAPCAAAARGRR